jgi:hypothetical protein
MDMGDVLVIEVLREDNLEGIGDDFLVRDLHSSLRP